MTYIAEIQFALNKGIRSLDKTELFSMPASLSGDGDFGNALLNLWLALVAQVGIFSRLCS